MAIVRFLMLLFLFPVVTGSPTLRAQDSVASPSPKPAAVPPDTQITGPDLQSQRGEFLWREESGDLIPVGDLLPESVVTELLKRHMEQTSVPRFTVAHQELSGSIDRNEVTLKLELQIQVRPAEEWVTIPMSFGEVFLKSYDHKSDAPNSDAVPEFGDPNSERLHLFGVGLHTVTLEMMGKARSPVPGVRQLSLNLLPATVSHAEIKFAGPVELHSWPVESVDEPTRDERGVRSVEFFGLPQAFNLSWSDVVQRLAQKPVIQVQNRLKLDLTTIPVNLTGRQDLRISGGPVNELRVTFPEGFLLQEVDAKNSNGVSILNNFEITSSAGGDDKGSTAVTALVRLTTAIESALMLSFDLELANRTFPQDIRVALPAVQDANVQSGDLDILFPTGLLVEQTVVEGAQRKRVTTETDRSIAATAFRMRSTESHVVLHVEETEAQFAVSPEATLRPDTQNVILTVRYPISVLTGALLDLAIYWPGYSSGEWEILPGTTWLISGDTSSPLALEESNTETDVLKTTFRERQSGEFTVEFQAFAPLAEVRSGAIQLRCPEIQARSGQPFVLTTIESDEFSIRPVSMGTGEPLPTVPLPTPTVAAGTGLKSESWLHDDASVPIRLELPDQAPSVRADVRLGMQPRGDDIEVHQTIELEVEHRDLTSLTLAVQGLQPTVRLLGHAEKLRATIDSETRWSFRLPEARRGNMTFDVSYVWTPTLATDALPVILPESADVLGIEAGTGSGTGLTVLDAVNWQPVYSEEYARAWRTGRLVTSVPIHWQKSLSLATGDSPDLILARTQILGNQRLTTTLAIFEKLPGTLIIETPLDVGLPAILIDKQPLVLLESNQRGHVRWEQLADRGKVRWTVSMSMTEQKTDTDKSPHIVECRIRTKEIQQSSLWQHAALERAIFVGESPSTPVIWYTGSQNEFQTTSASADFISLEHPELEALLAPYPAELRISASDILDHWISLSDRNDLFFGFAESRALHLNLVPFVSLLLVTAVVCVFSYSILSVLRRVSLVLPLLLLGWTALVAWLILPEWTVLLAPYVVTGIVFGVMSVVFQRMITDRRVRFSQAAPVGEYPTIFGFSGMLFHADPKVSGPSVVSPGTKSEFNASSFV